MRRLSALAVALGLAALVGEAGPATAGDGCPRLRSASLVIVIPPGGCGAPPPPMDAVTVIRSGREATLSALRLPSDPPPPAALRPAAAAPRGGDTIIAIGIGGDTFRTGGRRSGRARH